MKFRIYLFTLLFAVISFSSFAQTDTAFLPRVSSSLLDRATIRPVEKVYLHLDKPYYIPGDTIWFKAYTVVGNRHQLSALSGVLYCELVSKDSVASRRILKLIAGVAWGDFALPRSLKQGTYHIRAYTNWMRNAGPEYFYNQRIRIGGPQTIIAPANQVAAAKPDVQFFPEGGQLVNGVRSRVAVKCINANGLGEDIKGVITDNDNNEVAAFATQHLGMGVFALIPQPGKTYQAKIVAADSSKFTIDLPKAQEEGFTLAVNNTGADSIFVKVAANDKLFQAKQNTLFYVVGQSGGKVYYTAQAKLASPVFTTRIPKSRFPSGIVQFTLFSQNGEPLNERIIFVQHNDLNITLSPSPKTDATRQKVKIDIATKTRDTGIYRGSFSVAVINESRVAPNESDEGTILNNLLLTSDLKGYIEQSNYYFTNISDQTQADLDVLMLTQGYRSFEWKGILDNKMPPIAYQPERSLELNGSIKTPSGKPLPNSKILLTATRQNFLADTTADVEGNFKFTNLDLPDTARLVLRAKKANNGSNVAIYVKKADYPPLLRNDINTDTTARLTPQMLANIANYKQQLKEDSIKNAKALKGVTIKAKQGPKPDRFNGYGTSLEYNVDMKRLNDEITLRDALPMLIPGASYRMGKISYDFAPARLIIDGLPHSADQLDLYSPRELDNIRMVSATNMRPALLIITTKRYAGTDTAATQLKGVVIKGTKARKEPDLSRSASLHPGGADQVVMGDQLGTGINLSDRLRGRAHGISFAANGGPINNRGGGATSSRPNMSVIVDGNILSSNSLNDVNGDEVYSIEVLASTAARSIYGTSIESGGALVITMKHGGEDNYVTSVNPQGLITYPFKGFYKAKTFYSPKYDHPKTDTEQPDLRSTIYWNPNIITDKDGKATIEYFNADTKGTYRVVIEGIDDNGNLGRQVFRYKVE